MRIRTRIQLIIVLSVVMAATVGLLLFLSIQAMNEASKKAAIGSKVVKGVVELKILTSEYLLHPGDRSLIQWQSRYDFVTKRLTGGIFRSPDEKIHVNEILKNLERIKTVFTKITIGVRKKQQPGKQESTISRALQDRLEAELLVKAQATISLAFPLQQKIQAELVTTQKRAAFLTVLLLLTLTAVIVGISLWVNRSIARPIAKLEEDTQIIGSGNLDHKVGTTAKDEIGQLSRAFDEMTVDLKETTASIAELNKEIIERKQAEETLRKSELWLQSIFNSLEESVFVVTPDRKLVNINQAAQRMFGYSQKELASLSTEILHVGPEHYLEFGKRIKEAFDKGGVANFEFETKRKNGEIFPTEHTVSLLKDYQGEPLGIVSVVRDITERKQAEEQIKASLKEKEVLLREIHHRVKNNMQVISSLLKLQASSVGDERVTDALMECQRRVQTMAFVHEMLHGADSLAVIDFRTYIYRLVSEIFRSHSIGRDRVKMKVDAEEIKLGIEQATPLGLIVNELLNNSLKYGFPENRSGEIAISLREVEQDVIEFIFSDNGIGIPEDFDWRNTNSLGLQLVIILAENQLDGTVSLDREKGTRFTVRFRHEENE